MDGNRISARLDDRPVKVSNLSLTGALLLVDQPVPVDSRSTLVLLRQSIEVTVQTQVTRSDRASGGSSQWLVAVIFLSLSEEAKKLIPRLC
jgi:hypothetical protein